MECSIARSSVLLERYMAKNIPTFLWGPPGVGKSESVRQIIARKNEGLKKGDKKRWGLVDFRACLRDPVDIRGLPTVDLEKRRAIWLCPDELPNEERDGKYGILFMDELNTAPPAVMNACLGLVLDRKVAEYQLPPGWRIVAAGNRQSDRAAVNKMPRPLASRFAHIDIVPDLDASIDWMIENDVHDYVIAFLRWRPEFLYTLQGTDERAFPNPRNWGSRVSPMCDEDDNVRDSLIAGIIGDGPAAEFAAFINVALELPDFDDIVEKPKSTQIPEGPSGKYACSSMLSRRVKRNNFSQVLTYAKRLGRDFEIVTVLDATKRNPSLCETKAYVEFVNANKDVTLPNKG